MQQGVFEPFERRRCLFAPSSAAFAESGRVLAAVAARDGWQLLDNKPSLLNDALIAASCREQGLTLITKDGDFKRRAPFFKGFRYATVAGGSRRGPVTSMTLIRKGDAP